MAQLAMLVLGWWLTADVKHEGGWFCFCCFCCFCCVWVFGLVQKDWPFCMAKFNQTQRLFYLCLGCARSSFPPAPVFVYVRMLQKEGEKEEGGADTHTHTHTKKNK